MTGPWEQRLIDLSEGTAWDLPSRITLLNGLQSLKDVLQKVADNPGLLGESGAAAAATFSGTAPKVQEQINYVQVHLPIKLSDANDVRDDARASLAALPPGEMSPEQQALVRGAAVGSMFVLGPWAFVAGEGASRAINNHLAGERESAAEKAMQAHEEKLKTARPEAPPEFTPPEISPPPPPPGGESFDDGGGGGGGGTGFDRSPDGGLSPFPTNPGGGGDGTPTPPPGQTPDGIGTLPTQPVDPVYPGGPGDPGGPGPYGPFPDGMPNMPGKPPIDLLDPPPLPTPDGPISGSPTLPGGIPSLPGGGGGLVGGTPGSPGAGLGSGLTAGLVAGGGGAIALGRVGMPAGAPGGGLFGGASGPAGGAAGRGPGSGGLLGRGAGAGAGARGVGGLGGVGAGGTASSSARGAGTRGATAAGGTAAGANAGRGGSAAGGRAGAAAGRGGMGGMGGPGSRSDRKDDAARGLGGPIAPRMEDDEQIGPRSENAQAGGRDGADRSEENV